MGNEFIALGGLVPRQDHEIAHIVEEVMRVVRRLKRALWIHLFGIFRPKLQPLFKSLGVNNFDSATDLREAWLRAAQNYQGIEGRWSAALRVPLRDNIFEASPDTFWYEQLAVKEQNAPETLYKYERGEVDGEEALSVLLDDDTCVARPFLLRSRGDLAQKYRRTLVSRIWERWRVPHIPRIGNRCRHLSRNKPQQASWRAQHLYALPLATISRATAPEG